MFKPWDKLRNRASKTALGKCETFRILGLQICVYTSHWIIALSVIDKRAGLMLHEGLSKTSRSESIRAYRLTLPTGLFCHCQSFCHCWKHHGNWMFEVVCRTVSHCPCMSRTTLKTDPLSCDFIVGRIKTRIKGERWNNTRPIQASWEGGKWHPYI
jgi:hypothetical protein